MSKLVDVIKDRVFVICKCGSCAASVQTFVNEEYPDFNKIYLSIWYGGWGPKDTLWNRVRDAIKYLILGERIHSGEIILNKYTARELGEALLEAAVRLPDAE